MADRIVRRELMTGADAQRIRHLNSNAHGNRELPSSSFEGDCHDANYLPHLFIPAPRRGTVRRRGDLCHLDGPVCSNVNSPLGTSATLALKRECHGRHATTTDTRRGPAPVVWEVAAGAVRSLGLPAWSSRRGQGQWPLNDPWSSEPRLRFAVAFPCGWI